MKLTGARVPALDGVRGVAVLLVVAYHSSHLFELGAGSVGVTLFFALSGYLITGLLLAEASMTGSVAVGRFLTRRARRLLPALVVFLAAMAVLDAVTPLGLFRYTQAVAALLDLGNLLPMWGINHGAGLSHTWSLAVEEQFYLLWPLVLLTAWRFGRERAVAAVALVGAFGSLSLRLLLVDGGPRVYYGTDTRVDAMLLGCALAAVAATGWRPSRPRAWVVCSLVTLAAASLGSGEAWKALGATTVAAWASVALIAGVTSSCPTWPWLESAPLRRVGARSYALYLWHYPLVVVVAPALVGPTWVGVPVMLAASWFLAELSWHYVEAPVLRRKRTTEPVEGLPSRPVVQRDHVRDLPRKLAV